MRAEAQTLTAPVVQGVRPAHSLDVPWMLSIWRTMMAQHDQSDPAFALAENACALWEDGLYDLIARCDSFALVVPAQGFCCGWVTRPPPIYAAEQVGHLSEICVAEHSRGRGVGTALIQAAETWFAERELAAYQLATAMFNTSAQTFFAARGGRPISMRYTFVVPEDALARARSGPPTAPHSGRGLRDGAAL